MSAYEISVCICTHNPRREYLARVLEALAAQNVNPDSWELVLIDNQSSQPVGQWADLSKIRNARIVAEDNLGLTHARIRAIHESTAPIILFVDDDNILAPDYLQQAGRIMAEKPFLGVVGGRCRGEFEAPPPRWAWHYFPYLAIGDHGDQPLYIHHKNNYLSWYPYGAGMVIRRPFAETYITQIKNDPGRSKLGRRGSSLASADDIDMVLTVMDEGSAVGFCPELMLKHLIPRERLELSYLRRLIYHANYSLYQLMLARKIDYRPRRWPLAYLTSVILCFTHRYYHPYTLWLACYAARGRYAAYGDYRNGRNRS